MKTYFLLTLLFISFFSHHLNGQSIRDTDWHRADSIAMTIPKSLTRDPVKLANRLTRGLAKDEEKVRAIYRWIAENISYHVAALENEDKRTTDPRKVLRTRRAVCSGYSHLFEALCSYAGIECEVIGGFSKNRPALIGKRQRKPEHAWNAVRIRERWYLIDVTWGSGYVPTDSKRFHKYFKPQYFLANEVAFLQNHFPENPEWQLVEEPLTKEEFFRAPLAGSGALESRLISMIPGEGVIRQAAGEKIQFHFEFEGELRIAGIVCEAEPISQLEKKPVRERGIVDRNGQIASYEYTVPPKGKYVLDIYLNGDHYATYRLISQKRSSR